MKDGKMNIVIIAFVIIAAACGIFFIHEYCVAQKEVAEYSQIQEEYLKPEMLELLDSVTDPQDKPATLPYMEADFCGLLSVNPDTIGWLSIPDTPINYPVVQGTDNETYLNRSFEGEKSKAGAIFMDQANTVNPLNRNTVLYGHNMGGGRQDMFGSLLQYKDEEYFEKHRYIQFSVVGSKRCWWQIFAVLSLNVQTAEWNYLQLDFEDEEQFAEWFSTAKNKSLYETDVLPESSDNVLTLSTCARSKYGADGRLVIMAVQI